MTTLLDVNVLLALAWPHHVHHRAATAWFDEAVAPPDAVELLLRLTRRGRHTRWLDELTLGDPVTDWTAVRTHRQVTDQRLLALATVHGGRLASFDRRLAPNDSDERLLLLS